MNAHRLSRWTAAALCAASSLAMSQAPAPLGVPATQCSARSAATAATVIELYTSEGCSSCPPADRWLTKLKGDASLVALAFHVNYWDRLGWRDRFSSPAFTQRQAEQQAVNGSRYSYTPQVVLQGRDRRDWPGISLPLADSARAAPVDIAVSGDGRQFTATVQARAGAPGRLAAYWAITEDGHRSAVTAGENAGEKLAHDHVVRELQTVPAWNGPSATLQFTASGEADKAHPRAINLVVTDAATGRPVHALKLGC
jgi:hypothetical protein